MPQQFAEQVRSIPMSAALGDSLERARGFAHEQSHRTVTLEHLLIAFTEDPDASAVLQASNIDLLRLGTDVSGYLSRLPADPAAQGVSEGDPQPDAELVRVLQAAVQAAQQSRRRQIDGAIVLAAVVGDGKSPAAALLKEHGLTFEEAIRALQKTSAKAHAQARSKQYAPPPRATASAASAPAPDVPTPVTASAPLAPEPAPAPPPNGRASEGVGQTVEDILAAARARIQQRAASTGQAAKPPSPAPAPVPAPEPPPARSAPAGPPAPPPPPVEAPRRAEEPATMAPIVPPSAPAVPPAPPVQTAAAAPPPPAAPSPGRPPPAAGGPTPPRPVRQPPPGHRTAPPFAQQALRPGEGPPRPPLPGGRVEPGFPPPRPPAAGPMPVPWPSPDPPPAAPNGAAVPDSPLPAPAPRRPAQRTGGQPGQGPLVESIPRRMRAGVTATAQVRVSRERVDGLILLLMKAKGVRPEGLMARALTVRLVAPDGGFWIEALSPETQWAEAAAGGRPQEGHLTWRWSVTPQERGRGKLQLVVTARTVGRDGAVAETAPPDRTIEVAVSRGRLNGPRRWLGVLFTFAVGAIIGRFAGDVWAIASEIFKRAGG